MKRARTGQLAAALIVTLTACSADTTNFPSLARRPAERMVGSPAPAAPAPVAPVPDAGLPARLATLVEQARDADRRFAARREAAERIVVRGSGSAPGSESWAIASVALADLESARSDAMIALADLDELYAASRTASGMPGSGGDWATIAAARDQVISLIAEEDRVLADLRGRLGG
jgi:hypothetical protein